MKLDERNYTCSCGNNIDRDVNAAINLNTVGLAGINARGHEGSDYKHSFVVKPSWLNQELNHTPLCIN